MSTDQETRNVALRIARDVVKDAIRREGKKISSVTGSEISAKARILYSLDYAGLNKLAIEWNKSIAEFREKHRLSEMLI